jgi:hypothetical protein
MNPTTLLKDAFSFNIVKIISYKLWLGVSIICFYLDLIFTKFSTLLNFSNKSYDARNILFVIIATGAFIMVVLILHLLLIGVVSKLPKKLLSFTQKKNEVDKNKIFRSTLEDFALLHSRNDLLDMAKSHESKEDEKRKVYFLNLVLLALVLSNFYWKGFISLQFCKLLFGNDYSFVYINVIASLTALILALVNTNEFIKIDGYIRMDRRLQDQLGIKTPSVIED